MDIGDLVVCLLFCWDRTVLLVPPFFVNRDVGRQVPCYGVAGESDYAFVERGPVCIREGEFFNPP